ncbi:S-layer homology domain-containing protein [Effusibacillus consociatus]|uniref:S-layer homology domain-containing protein n=1 Tax=Effusibacillus consociatus TaxID=1117041 RepID=A0ABV9Q0G5_9BACL
MFRSMKTVSSTLACATLLVCTMLLPASVSQAQTPSLQNLIPPQFTQESGGSGEVGGDVGGSIGPLPGHLPGEESEIHQPFMVGFPDGKFYPERSFSRAEAATVVAKVKKLKYDAPLEKPYQDVSSNHWAYRYITSVTKAGYMKGYPDGTFHPDEPISRAELVALVLEVRGIEPMPGQTGFSDTGHHWAADMIATARSLGFVSGMGDNKFMPDDATERQVAARMFCVAFQRGPLADGEVPVKQHFSDVKKDHWSFPWVEEAAVEAHESIRTGTEECLVKYRPELTERY